MSDLLMSPQETKRIEISAKQNPKQRVQTSLFKATFS